MTGPRPTEAEINAYVDGELGPEAQAQVERHLGAEAEDARRVSEYRAIGEALHALQGDETRWEETVESFREAHRAWHEHGFMHMLRALLQLERAREARRALHHRRGHRFCGSGERGLALFLRSEWCARRVVAR